MRDVVALVRPDHQKLVLLRRGAVQPVAAVEHEDLERRHAVIGDQMLHLVDMRGFDRRDVESIVDPELVLGLLVDLGHERAIGPAAVEVIMPRADVVEARGDAAHRGRLAFRDRILGERRVDPDMHVRIDAARERQPVLGVEDLLRLPGLDVGRKPRDLSVLDRDIEAVDRRLVRADDAGVLDDGIENFVHARHSLT